MTRRRTFVLSKLPRCGASLLALSLVAITWTVSGEQVKQPSERDARRIRRFASPDSAARQRFLELFARAYFPGRTGQLLIVPREGDFITRPDPNVAYMHGSPWSYDVSIPLMFAGPAVKTGVFSVPAAQQDVAPTLAAALGVQMPPTATGRVLPVLRRGFARPRVVMLEPGAPVVLFPTRILGAGVDAQQGWQYDVAPDGRFVINTVLDNATAPITLLQNWNPEAKK